MRKRLTRLFFVLSVVALSTLSCNANSYTGGMTEFLNAILLPGTNTFNATVDNLSKSSTSLGTMGGTSLSIYGNNYSMNGNNLTSGVTVNSGSTLSVNNFGSFDSSNNVVNSIKNFKVANGGVINNAGTVTIANDVFSGNTATTAGGVLYNSGTATVTNSYFTGNSAPSGGAIYNAGNLTVRDSIFKSNSAGTIGGAIYNTGVADIYNSSFISNSAQYAPAIFNNDYATLTLHNCTVSNNTVTNNYGALYNHVGSIMHIYDSTFSSNNGVNGNAIYSYWSSLLDIKNSTFSDNITSTSAAVYANKNDSVTINNSIFSGNRATGTCGAFMNYNGPSISITNSTFDNNYGTSGAAIYNYILAGTTNSTNLSNNTFTKNSALNTAGAVYNFLGLAAGASASGNLTMSNNNFIQNKIINYSTSASTVQTWSGAFLNYATASAASTANASNTSTITNCNFIENSIDGSSTQATVKSYAGAVGNTCSSGSSTTGTANATMSIDNSNFINNWAKAQALGTASNTAAYVYGGAICNSVTETSTKTAITTLNITNSTFTGNSATAIGTSSSDYVAAYGGAIYNKASTLNIKNSTFANNSSSHYGGAIYNSSSVYAPAVVNITADGGNTVFTGNTANGISNAIYLQSGTMNLNANSGNSIVFNDKIASEDIDNPININKTGDGAIGNPALGAPTTGNISFNNNVSNSTINLYSGTMTLGRESYLNGNNLNINGGSINMMNGGVGTLALNNLNLANGTTTNIGVDADLASLSADKITAASLGAGTGKINISGVNVLSESKSGSASVNIVSDNLKNAVQLGSSTVMAPIFKYNLAYDNTTGNLNFVNAGGGGYENYNPSVLSKPISSLTGTYLNQVNVYNEALGRADIFMSLPQMDRVLMRYQNKYAYAGDPVVFSPTFLPEVSGGLWVKQYTTFENIPLNNGPNVSNVGYGVLIGGDTPLKHLKHGCDGYLTAYVGYNGSHQNYSNVGIYQNGGVLGLTGTLYKGNFFTALTANVGATNGNATNPYGNDNFTTLLVGTAWKAGYNFEMLRGKLILQPSYSMSYTFADTYDYTAASGVNISSNPLNALQIAPGVKLIGNLKDGWQPYLAANMVWNIMDGQKFYANNVELPQMTIAPYVEYGVGLQRKWGSRFTGFGQAMLRGGGRNGIALQFGFRYAIGK